MSKGNDDDNVTWHVSPMDHVLALEATVIEGFGRGGKQLGCPTANMSTEEIGVDKLNDLPTGIYCGWATVNGEGPYKAVTSIGWNPYYKNDKKTVEPHLIHIFDEDFYGAKLKLVLCGYLRPEKNFDSLEALIDAIKTDIRLSSDALETPQYKGFQEHPLLIHPK